MTSHRDRQDDLIRSATGKLVKKGAVHQINAPEIKYSEIEWGPKIGVGCFGSVYKGKCRGIEVAVKKLMTQELSEKNLEAFRKEVDILTQMRHPNVVLFMGACTKAKKMCIVTELMEDSVHGLLRKNTTLTIAQRIKMVKGAATGMAWLHGATPQIIHRDIKPENFLVDKHLNVKVCDFGLSQVKTEPKIRDGQVRLGTPLWMSPEVLTGKDVDEKSDVYSFGIVMWEIVTGKEPFAEMDDLAKFKKAIVQDDVRPPLPPDMNSTLQKLIKECWQKDPNKRPPFTTIIKVLETILLKCLVIDKKGYKFWKKYFKGREELKWAEFADAFGSFLKLPKVTADNLNWNCLRKILEVYNERRELVVTMEQFGHVLDWFGPMDSKTKDVTILDKIRTVMEAAWFHGDVKKGEAEDLLSGQPRGTYLVRTSTTERTSPFTISKVAKGNAINHQRIQKNSDGTFEIAIKSGSSSGTEVSKDDLLVPFLESLADALYLKSACPGSKFQSLFKPSRLDGYM